MYRPYVRDQSGTIAQLMQQMSQSKRTRDLEMLDASPRKLDFFGQVTQGAYDSYLAAKEQEKIDAEKAAALEIAAGEREILADDRLTRIRREALIDSNIEADREDKRRLDIHNSQKATAQTYAGMPMEAIANLLGTSTSVPIPGPPGERLYVPNLNASTGSVDGIPQLTPGQGLPLGVPQDVVSMIPSHIEGQDPVPVRIETAETEAYDKYMSLQDIIDTEIRARDNSIAVQDSSSENRAVAARLAVIARKEAAQLLHDQEVKAAALAVGVTRENVFTYIDGKSVPAIAVFKNGEFVRFAKDDKNELILHSEEDPPVLENSTHYDSESGKTIKTYFMVSRTGGIQVVGRVDATTEPGAGQAVGVTDEGNVVWLNSDGSTEVLEGVFDKQPEQTTGMFLSDEQKRELINQSNLGQSDVDSKGKSWTEIMRAPTGPWQKLSQTGPGSNQLKWISQFLGTQTEGQRARERVNIAVIDLVKILEDQGRHSQSQRDWIQANMGDIQGDWDISKGTLYVRFQELKDLVDSIVRNNFVSLTSGNTASETKDRQEWMILKGASNRVLSAFGFPETQLDDILSGVLTDDELGALKSDGLPG